MAGVVRRRHRTWMLSISLATLGWGVWWAAFALWRLAPEHAPPVWAVQMVATPLALLGLIAAVLCLRARLAWVLLTLIPFGANLGLLVMPLLLPAWRALLAQAE